MKPLPIAHDKASTWFPFTRPSAQARVRLFCLPYGGGGAWVYRHLSEIIPHDVDVCPIELPGRATRSNETPFIHGPQLVAEIAQAMRPHLDLPYAIFGYSLGALLAFEVTRQLRQDGQPLPLHLFVAARRAPHLPSSNVAYTDDELIEELRRLGGTPKEVLENKELLYRSLPCIRADFSMDQKYTYRQEPPLACPITVLGGLDDMAVPRDSLETWSVHTTGVWLADLWSQVLGVEQPGANDHFFDLGGHSFSAVQLAFHIRRSFGRELPLGALFANPCLSAMAKVIE